MKILMFGWEFPPFITGGLGTACYGMSQSLAKLVDKITFVLPRVKGAVDTGEVDVIGAHGFQSLPLDTPGATNGERRVRVERRVDEATTTLCERIEIQAVDSPLTPYATAAGYAKEIERLTKLREERHRLHEWATGGAAAGQAMTDDGSIIEISGDYGKDLLSEVWRFGIVGGRIARSADFDLIHAHDWMTFPAGVEAKRATGLPLVVHVHALEFDRCGDNIDQRIYDIERFGMEAADRIIAVSHRTKEMIVARYGIPADKIDVVHNGISARSLRPLGHVKKMPEKLVVFLGRITQQKGPEYFLEAAHLVAQKVPGVRFVMAGSGDMMPRMIDRMAELRLVDKFHFTGFIDAKRRDDLLAMADCFVMTSVSEPFGLTPVEAIQHDVPVVVTKQCGVSEVLRSALKVDFWDVRRIADAILKVLTEESLAHAIVEGARDDLAAINWDRAAEKIKRIYEETL